MMSASSLVAVELGPHDGRLGLLTDLDDPGTFTIPTEFSTDDYATVAVDISVEPHDGNDDHSGRSILRGALTEA